MRTTRKISLRQFSNGNDDDKFPILIKIVFLISIFILSLSPLLLLFIINGVFSSFKRIVFKFFRHACYKNSIKQSRKGELIGKNLQLI